MWWHHQEEVTLSFQEPVAAMCMLPNTTNNDMPSNLALFKFFNIVI